MTTGYGPRNAKLENMGYGSYREYLASDKWKGIRERIRKPDCAYCGEPTQAVHHTRYEAKVLRGQSLKGLKSVCDSCHKFIEFDSNGTKRSCGDARYVTLAMDSMMQGCRAFGDWRRIEGEVVRLAEAVRAEVADGRSFKFAIKHAERRLIRDRKRA